QLNGYEQRNGASNAPSGGGAALREVGLPPLTRRTQRETSAPQRPPHPFDRPPGVDEDAARAHLQDAPLDLVEVLAPLVVGLPLRQDLDVVAPVVLHGQPLCRIAQV